MCEWKSFSSISDMLIDFDAGWTWLSVYNYIIYRFEKLVYLFFLRWRKWGGGRRDYTSIYKHQTCLRTAKVKLILDFISKLYKRMIRWLNTGMSAKYLSFLLPQLFWNIPTISNGIYTRKFFYFIINFPPSCVKYA